MKSNTLLKIGIVGGVTLAGYAIATICKAAKDQQENLIAVDTLHSILNDMALDYQGACLEDDFVTASRISELYDKIICNYQEELLAIGVLQEVDFAIGDEHTDSEVMELVITILNALRSAHSKSVSGYNSTKFEASTEGESEVHRQDANMYADAYNTIISICKEHLADMNYPHMNKLDKLNMIGDDVKLHKSIRLNMNGGYMANVVREDDLNEHIQYNLANHYGSALLIDDEVVQYGHFKEDQKEELIKKSKSIPVVLTTATLPYR